MTRIADAINSPKPVTWKSLARILDEALAPAVKQLRERCTALEQQVREADGRIVSLEVENAAIKAELGTALLKSAGIWRHGSMYRPGDVAQFKGTRWVCTKAHTASATPDHSCWQLWEKTDAR